MYFDLEDNVSCKPLPHNPFKACVAPRPIGWISSLSADGIANIGPYSFFNGVASEPPLVMYSSNGYQPHGPKDTVSNIESTGEFVVNVATWDLRDAMNETSAPATADVDEFALAGLTPAPSEKVKAPRILESPVNMECVLVRSLDLPCDVPDSRNILVVGRVVALHIDERVLTDGMVDMDKLQPISRLGYLDYAKLGERFTMSRPGGGDKLAGNT